jgi:hypothetical protein
MLYEQSFTQSFDEFKLRRALTITAIETKFYKIIKLLTLLIFFFFFFFFYKS